MVVVMEAVTVMVREKRHYSPPLVVIPYLPPTREVTIGEVHPFTSPSDNHTIIRHRYVSISLSNQLCTNKTMCQLPICIAPVLKKFNHTTADILSHFSCNLPFLPDSGVHDGHGQEMRTQFLVVPVTYCIHLLILEQKVFCRFCS